jgi:hypothetical protein
LFVAVEPWGAGSFENDVAGEWFLLVEEAVDPGAVIASALDQAVGEADFLDLEASCEAVAAAELSASCAGHPPERLPDRVRGFVEANAHEPHGAEIEQAVEAVTRVRTESELREIWDAAAENRENEWLHAIDDLIARLRRSGAGDPASLSP